ncbi:hypothetical protein KY366_05415 [Candidatus Woesearchaeota archaeon]|nr:hypothetical protein [Candidatus Woesearchaeota archaeon]
MLKEVSKLNKKIPKIVRFIFGLIILNIPPITYLTLAGAGIAPIYVAAVFLLINIASLIAYFKLKEIEVEAPIGRVKVKR